MTFIIVPSDLLLKVLHKVISCIRPEICAYEQLSIWLEFMLSVYNANENMIRMIFVFTFHYMKQGFDISQLILYLAK